MERLIHDIAWATTANIMDCIGPVFMDGERNDARDIIYEAIKEAVKLAFAERAREQARLNPCSN